MAQVIIPRLIPVLVRDVSFTLGDVTLVNRVTSTLLIALVDATAPYHPTAVGVFTRFDRRPQEEWNGTNVNTAMLYAAHHSLRGAVPHREDVWITYLTDFGLDPADNMDLTTAAGIGAAAGKGAMAARLHDGMNQTGIYADNTGYQGAAVQNHLGPADFARVDFLSMLAAIDSSIVTWQEKWRYDAVRPVSAIQHVYGDELVTAWGGPGMGTMEIPASQWRSYIPEADHPEYPSASTCGCYAHGQSLRRYFGTDELNWAMPYSAGSSRIEPGITPAEDIELHFATWTEFEEECAKSRVYAGVHFQAAVNASAEMCHAFGDLMYEYFVTLMDDTAAERGPMQALEPDPMRFDRSE